MTPTTSVNKSNGGAKLLETESLHFLSDRGSQSAMKAVDLGRW